MGDWDQTEGLLRQQLKQQEAVATRPEAVMPHQTDLLAMASAFVPEPEVTGGTGDVEWDEFNQKLRGKMTVRMARQDNQGDEETVEQAMASTRAEGLWIEQSVQTALDESVALQLHQDQGTLVLQLAMVMPGQLVMVMPG